ncbi:MAG: hypothetical protein FJX31_10820, partial [Alphaproteobacteria bacterium]|nr:hypothetical protein [Alphaproteobacteria bacterium]
MRLRWIVSGIALATASGWALAQRAPESLLPPGFDDPPPVAAPAPAAPSAPAASAPRPSGAAQAQRPTGPTGSAAPMPGIGAVDGV